MNNVQYRRADAAERRHERLTRLVDCAEAAIVANGFASLRARELALCAGCSVGTVYTLVADLDELVLRVSQRTIRHLGSALEQVEVSRTFVSEEDRLIAWAIAYRTFAETNRNRWRALFEFRLDNGKDLPTWFEADRAQLFAHLEDKLATLFSTGNAEQTRSRARTLFSAVHGIVALGIEGRLAGMASHAIDEELALFLRTYFAGLARP